MAGRTAGRRSPLALSILLDLLVEPGEHLGGVHGGNVGRGMGLSCGGHRLGHGAASQLTGLGLHGHVPALVHWMT